VTFHCISEFLGSGRVGAGDPEATEDVDEGCLCGW
jgi:hypothetical protein